MDQIFRSRPLGRAFQVLGLPNRAINLLMPLWLSVEDTENKRMIAVVAHQSAVDLENLELSVQMVLTAYDFFFTNSLVAPDTLRVNLLDSICNRIIDIAVNIVIATGDTARVKIALKILDAAQHANALISNALKSILEGVVQCEDSQDDTLLEKAFHDTFKLKAFNLCRMITLYWTRRYALNNVNPEGSYLLWCSRHVFTILKVHGGSNEFLASEVARERQFIGYLSNANNDLGWIKKILNILNDNSILDEQKLLRTVFVLCNSMRSKVPVAEWLTSIIGYINNLNDQGVNRSLVNLLSLQLSDLLFSPSLPKYAATLLKETEVLKTCSDPIVSDILHGSVTSILQWELDGHQKDGPGYDILAFYPHVKRMRLESRANYYLQLRDSGSITDPDPQLWHAITRVLTYPDILEFCSSRKLSKFYKWLILLNYYDIKSTMLVTHIATAVASLQMLESSNDQVLSSAIPETRKIIESYRNELLGYIAKLNSKAEKCLEVMGSKARITQVRCVIANIFKSLGTVFVATNYGVEDVDAILGYACQQYDLAIDAAHESGEHAIAITPIMAKRVICHYLGKNDDVRQCDQLLGFIQGSDDVKMAMEKQLAIDPLKGFSRR